MDEIIYSDKNRYFINKLHNRMDFFRIADNELKGIENGVYCLVAIDIEHFKLFNKWYGREKGDDFLNQFSEIFYYLEEEKQGICGYFGGDNFVTLMKYGSIELNRVQEDLNQCAMDIGKSIGFLPAYGIYKIKDKTISVETMYDMSLLALSQVKGNFDNRVCIYNESMTDSVEEELRIISEVKDALNREQFTFFVQPKCNISNGKIVGAEALVRWDHPEKGIISPGYFIPVLEKNGFIGDLDRCVWEMVCKWIRRCIDMKFTPIPISINVSRLDVISMDVPEILMEITEKYNIDHSLLRVEITESACVETTDSKIQGTVKKIQNAGFTVLMDDFGSGYSSLNMLKSVMIDVIKIDMKFLDISEDETSKGIGILESVVNMSNSMGIPIIVEGVENKRQEDYLIGMGCHFAQGYYYYKPMPISEFEKLLVDRDNFDYKGVFVNQSEQVHINEIVTSNGFSESQFNNILGAVSFFDMTDGVISVTKVNDQFYNLLGTEVDYDITKARFLWDNIFYKDRENILELFRDAEENQVTGSQGKIKFINPDGNEEIFSIKLFLLKTEVEHKQFIGLYSKAGDNKKKNQSEIKSKDYPKSADSYTESRIKVEKIYDTLPFGFTLFDLCLNTDRQPVDIEVIYSNREIERLFNCEALKVKIIFRKNFGRNLDDILQKCYEAAYMGKEFTKEIYNNETGKYLKHTFFQYRYGFIGVITNDVTSEHICEGVIKSDRIKDSEIFFVDLENNSYNLIYPTNSEHQRYGIYSEAIKKDFLDNEILYITKDELDEFLSIKGIRKTLAYKESAEISYKYKNNRNFFAWSTVTITAGERENGIVKNILIRIDKHSKKTLNNILSSISKKSVMFIEKGNADYSAIKDLLGEKYNIISAETFDEAVSEYNEKCESIALILVSSAYSNDELINMLNVIKSNEYIDEVPVIYISDKNDFELIEYMYNIGVSAIIHEMADSDKISDQTRKVINLFMEKTDLKQKISGVSNEYTDLSDKYDIILKLEKHNGLELDIAKRELTLINNVYSPEMFSISKRFNKGKMVIDNFPDILDEYKLIDSAYFVELKNAINYVLTNKRRKYSEIPLMVGRNKEVWIGFYLEPLLNEDSSTEKMVGTYKVVTQKREKVLKDVKNFNTSEFSKLNSVREIMVNLSRDTVVDLSDDATKQWNEIIGESNITYSNIVNFVMKNQVASEYKKQYYEFFSPDALLAKYNGEPVLDCLTYQFYQRSGVRTFKCHAYILEIDTSGDIYAFLKYVDEKN